LLNLDNKMTQLYKAQRSKGFVKVDDEAYAYLKETNSKIYIRTNFAGYTTITVTNSEYNCKSLGAALFLSNDNKISRKSTGSITDPISGLPIHDFTMVNINNTSVEFLFTIPKMAEYSTICGTNNILNNVNLKNDLVQVSVYEENIPLQESFSSDIPEIIDEYKVVYEILCEIGEITGENINRIYRKLNLAIAQFTSKENEIISLKKEEALLIAEYNSKIKKIQDKISNITQ